MSCLASVLAEERGVISVGKCGMRDEPRCLASYSLNAELIFAYVEVVSSTTLPRIFEW